MPDDLLKRLKDMSEAAVSEIADVTVGIADSAAAIAKDKYERSGLKSTLATASKTTKEFLDSTGVTDAAGRAAEVTGDHLDTLSGAKLLALVEERLAIQSKYNDILATKLEEALDRIKRLEEAILTCLPK
jgi:hypothetical protein